MSKLKILASACAFVVLSSVAASGLTGDSSPVYGVKVPDGYRHWEVITVAHEAGENNDIRAVLGNDIALKAFRDGTRPFPDGTIIARLAYFYESSPENDQVVTAPQSFVAGKPTNVQISIKDSKKYPETGGWGYGQFENGVTNPSEPLIKTCFACHVKLDPSKDFVFSHYSP
ncbi:cytochrome P460 [Mesorhizobium sp. M2E.F.Ca.ET.209.01.1.1]|uniref:cytochrome P460 family protein n=1 Tax=Mesorhizobium sp. M2E.F.Ca.ET.209.01.1.1 TaxID=2500526 RepID=UPI000FDC567E|nr:cytochrome P460 family protein [Mesorhizobium sp. M2E.F.Ca.ET.209.01.1.1]TGS16832.1 cytochrome P460 [Mesorhizobium sp. M2E.F.Ca.ET.209.01.1.1]